MWARTVGVPKKAFRPRFRTARPKTVTSQFSETQVFYHNVPSNFPEAELLQIFRRAGAVRRLWPFREERGRRRGMGICEYSTPQEAARAVRLLEGRAIDMQGRQLHVRLHKTTREPVSRKRRLTTSPANAAPEDSLKEARRTLRRAAAAAAQPSDPGRLRSLYEWPWNEKNHRDNKAKTDEQVVSRRVVCLKARLPRQVSSKNERPQEQWHNLHGRTSIHPKHAICEPEHYYIGTPNGSISDGNEWERALSAEKGESDCGSDDSGDDGQETGSRIFFHNVPFDVDEVTLKTVFGLAAKVERINLFHDRNGRFKGQGICEFASHLGANRAIQELDGRPITSKAGDGVRALRVQVHDERRQLGESVRSAGEDTAADGHIGNNERESGSSIFFHNVPFDVDESILRTVFELAARVKRIKLFHDHHGRSRGQGICEFVSPLGAERAIRQLDGRPVAENSGDGVRALRVQLHDESRQAGNSLQTACENDCDEPQLEFIPKSKKTRNSTTEHFAALQRSWARSGTRHHGEQGRVEVMTPSASASVCAEVPENNSLHAGINTERSAPSRSRGRKAQDQKGLKLVSSPKRDAPARSRGRKVRQDQKGLKAVSSSKGRRAGESRSVGQSIGSNVKLEEDPTPERKLLREDLADNGRRGTDPDSASSCTEASCIVADSEGLERAKPEADSEQPGAATKGATRLGYRGRLRQ